MYLVNCFRNISWFHGAWCLSWSMLSAVSRHSIFQCIHLLLLVWQINLWQNSIQFLLAFPPLKSAWYFNVFETTVKQLCCNTHICAKNNSSEFTNDVWCSLISQNNFTWVYVLMINCAETTSRVILIIKSICTENQAQTDCSCRALHLNSLGL